MATRGIKYVDCYGVDNALVKVGLSLWLNIVNWILNFQVQLTRKLAAFVFVGVMLEKAIQGSSRLTPYVIPVKEDLRP
nr:UDP-N-acetylglucosamine diphosphorylase 1-like [Ipomoea batatas]